ncbi:MAG TPA: class I SAM-dependent methyltransferase [Candidatus Methylomirabilis sp.]|nr:class I SAM-dependent methyltransferase [Candidatus Methylomirabilis sp.]
MEDRRKRARELAAEFLRKGDPTGWFDALYQEGEQGKSIVPWADRGTNPNLMAFWKKRPQESQGKSALVVGSGLGDDAEQFAKWGYQTTAFDISEAAIRMTRRRFPESRVAYLVADLFAPPAEWRQKFDFVFEANTLQALPSEVRARAIERIASFVKPGGKLLVIARGRQADEPEGQMPWPLTQSEMKEFVRAGLTEENFEEFFDNEEPPARRFRGLYVRR